jgi:acyl-CoA synthetase (AMP-forming)/AMP-acid ligase II
VALSGILMMLLTGGALVVPDDIDLRTPAMWVTLVNRERVTVWHSPPALAALLVEHLQGRGDDAPRSLRLALLGGEPLALPLVDRLRGLVGPQLRVVNLCRCGPAGLWASCFEVTETGARRGHVPIGAPLANKHLYVLSDAGTLCPVWVTGRLHVGARGLPALGWGDTGAVDAFELTGELLYRTDLGSASTATRSTCATSRACSQRTRRCSPPPSSRQGRAPPRTSNRHPVPRSLVRNSLTTCARRCRRTSCPPGSTRLPHCR